MININNSNDPDYRYKMNELKIKIIKRDTVLENIDIVSQQINTPVNILIKYIGCRLGCSVKNNKLNGVKPSEDINKALFCFIDAFIVCKSCGIPEINYELENKKVVGVCLACGNLHQENNFDKINNKFYGVIASHLVDNKWPISGGCIK